MNFKLKSICIGIAVAFSASSASADVIVDLFSTNQGPAPIGHLDSIVDGIAVGDSVGNADATILGGNRDLFVDLINQAQVDDFSTIKVSSGTLSFANTPGAGGRGIVQWDGNEGTAVLDKNGLGGANLSTVTNFEVTTILSDLGYQFSIGAYTQGDANSWTVATFVASAVNLGSVTSYIPLAGFQNCGFNNGIVQITCGATPVNFANLGALELILNVNGGQTEVDLRLDSVRGVPEPGVLALFGSALLFGAGALRRRVK